MEKTKSIFTSSLRVVAIVVVILILIFLSFFMVRIVPTILSSMANATVSISSGLFPAGKDTATSSSSSVVVSNASTTTTTTSNNEGLLSKLFGGSNAQNTPANFTVATSSNRNANNNSANGRTYNNRNNSSNYQRVGVPDLSVEITSIGTMDSNGNFVAKTNFTNVDTIVTKFRVTNIGTGPSGAWSMRVDMPSSNASDQVKTVNAGSLPAGASVVGQAIFNTPAAGTNQTVTITVDPNGAIAESNKNNNKTSVSLNISQYNSYNVINNGYNYNYNYGYNYNNGYYSTSLPNLSVRLIAIGKVDPYNQFTQTNIFNTADKVSVKFEVTNNGSSYTSSWFWNAKIVGPNPYYNAYYNNNSYNNGYVYSSDGSRTYTSPYPEAGLAPGESKTYTVTFDGLTYGSNYITVNVDSSNNISESNEGDNTLSQSFFVNY